MADAKKIKLEDPGQAQPVPQIEGQSQEPGKLTSNEEEKSGGGAGDGGTSVAPKRNPFISPVVLDHLKTVAGTEEFKGFRELSVLYKNFFEKTYFDELGTIVTLDWPGPLEFSPSVSSANLHIVRQLVLALGRLPLRMPTPLLDDLKSMAPYLVGIKIKTFYIGSLGWTKSFSHLALMFHELSPLLLKLSELEMKMDGNGCPISSLVPGMRSLLDILPPQNIKITIDNGLHHSVSDVDTISKSFPSKIFPSRKVNLSSPYLTIDTELELNQILQQRITNAQWYQENNLKFQSLVIDPETSDAFDLGNNGFRILNSFEKLMSTFNENGLMGLDIYQDVLMEKIDWLGRSLNLYNWKQNIYTLHLQAYVHPLIFLRDFPKLTEICLDECDLNSCLLSNLNMTDEDNLNQVFGGFENLEVTLSSFHGTSHVQPDNPLALHIQTLVRTLEFFNWPDQVVENEGDEEVAGAEEEIENNIGHEMEDELGDENVG